MAPVVSTSRRSISGATGPIVIYASGLGNPRRVNVATRQQTRTVRFFEVVDRKSGLPLEHDLPWSDALAALSRGDISPGDRTVKFAGEDHHGGPWQMSGLPDMLLFSKIREDYDLPDVFDRTSGALEALQIAETQGIAETTHVGFFPSNIVGMIRTNTTPGAGSLEAWVNGMHLFDGTEPVLVQPLSRVAVTARVADVEQARGISVRMRTTAAQAIADRAPRLADITERLNQQFGSVMVEMRIYIPQDQGHVEESTAIMDEAEGLLALTADGAAVEGLQAAHLTYLSREKEVADDINILKDKLAERVEVEVIDEEGRSTRRESAAQAMQHAYNRLEDDLQAAVGRSRD